MAFGIVLALLIADCEQAVVMEKRSLKSTLWQLVWRLVVLCSLMLGVLYCFGFMNFTTHAEGFHFYGADLLTFFDSMGRGLFGSPFRQKAGHYEGFAWPGLGVWLLIGLFLLTGKTRSWLKQLWQRKVIRWLLFICVLMWFYALSNRIYIAGHWVINLKWLYLPFKWITGPFRTGGRFLWPLYYLGLIFT
jgi:hypothetical protein